MKRLVVTAVISGLLAASGTAWAQGSKPGKDAKASQATAVSGDIIDTAVAAGFFGTLAAALKAAGLIDALKGSGPFTVFAPTDAAFAKLPPGTVETLLKPENKARLVSILKYHVVSGEVMAKDVRTMSAPTLAGQRIDLVVKGGKVTVDQATVTQTDVKATNGVIHVIDTVIMPNDKDLVATAVGAGQFKTLAMLLERANLVSALQGTGPFTVFAPTDEAFGKLPKETLENLLQPENSEKLAAILKYHVVQGAVYADAAAKGATVSSLQGNSITTKSQGGKVMIENAAVVAADIEASNGVIHVIDTVLIPK